MGRLEGTPAQVLEPPGLGSCNYDRTMSKGRSEQPEAAQVDLTRFKSVEDAVGQANPLLDEFKALAKKISLANDGNITYLSMFLLSAISRATGLHLAAVHAIETSNPHAAIPLIRSYADVVVTALYVRDHPRYVDAITSRRRDAKKKRRSIGALVTAVTPYAPGIKIVYDELSEGTHFGAVAMWASWTPGEGGKVTYTTYPTWRDPVKNPLVITAWLIELGDAFVQTVESMIAHYLN